MKTAVPALFAAIAIVVHGLTVRCAGGVAQRGLLLHGPWQTSQTRLSLTALVKSASGENSAH